MKDFYREYHEYEYHPHAHWAAFIAAAFVFSFLIVGVANDAYHAETAEAQVAVPNQPLVQKANLSLVGRFRLEGGESRFGYGGASLSFYRDGNGRKTLFVGGHAWYPDRVGQVNVTGVPGTSSNWDSFPLAATLQNPVDVTQGRISNLNPGDPNSKIVYGTLPYNGGLIVGASSYYDGAGSQVNSHGVAANLSTLSAANNFQGFFRMSGAANARSKGGYMTYIPQEWQSLLGGSALTGNCCLSIITVSSAGPSATVFNPSDVSAQNPIPGTTLLFYPLSNPISGGGCSTQNDKWNCASGYSGMVFPDGTNSVLFFGTMGTGPVCYKGDKPNCPDNGGYNAPPYRAQILAYDAAELLKVKNGQLQPHQVQPYAVWSISDIIGVNNIGGVAYDSVERRIYIYSSFNGDGERATIHVLQLNVGSSTTPAAVPPSEPSQPATPPADTQAPSTPSGVSASAVSSSQISVSWNASADNVGVAGYRVYRCQGTSCSATAEIGNVISGTSFEDPGRNANISYRYRVRAYDAAGNFSNYSGYASATTQAAATPPAAGQQATSSAPVVSNVNVSVTQGAAVVTWTTNIAANARVEYGSAQSYSSNSQTRNTLSTTHTRTLTNLSPGTYNLRAVSVASNATGRSENIVFVVRPKPPTIPFVNVTPGSIVLNWPVQSFPGFAGVAIIRSTNGFITSYNPAYLIATTTATTYRDENVTPGTTYYYSLFVYDDQGNYSDPATVSFVAPQPEQQQNPPPSSSGGGSGGGGGSSSSSSGGGGSSSGSSWSGGSSSSSSGPSYSTPSLPTNFASLSDAQKISVLTQQISQLQSLITSLSAAQGGITAPSGTGCAFSRNLHIGLSGEDVRCLQRFLNGSGFQVSNSGAGSFGNESNYFGPATLNAVARWQSASGISPAAGYFGQVSIGRYNQTR